LLWASIAWNLSCGFGEHIKEPLGMIQVYRNVVGKHKDKFPDGKEYLLDVDTKKPVKFTSVESLINLFKFHGHKIETKEDLIRWGLNLESVDE
jgi:hypothetical protein